MQLHTIIRVEKFKKKKRIGRGGKRGTYSGKGIKGQKARAGRKMRPELRDIIKRIPKKRGYRFASIQEKSIPINLFLLEKFYSNGDTVSLKTLREKGVLRKSGAKRRVKILGSGELTKKLIISGCVLSKSSEEAVRKAGGTITS